MRKILECVNQLPAEDVDIAKLVWRTGGCEALATWANVNFQILDMTGAQTAALSADELLSLVRSAQIEDYCLKMAAMIAEDCK